MSNNKDTKDFGQGSVAVNIMRLAVPMTLAQLINILYNIVDRIYIGHIPGASTYALTGIGLVVPIITMITAFTNLFGMGGSPLFSMSRGAGDLKRAEKIMGNAFSMLIITGIILASISFLFRKPILYLFGASDITYPYAEAYLNIYVLGTLFVMISVGMNYFINAQGFGITGMLTVSIGAILNLILDPIFIFVLNMGIRGAALATVISQGVSALWVLKFLTGKKAILQLTGRSLPIELPLIREICSLGLSGFIMAFTNGAVQIACNSTLQTYGGDLYVGLMTVLNSVRELTALPISGIANAAQPVISFNFGARKYTRVKSAISFLIVINVATSMIVWAAIFFFPRFFIQMFSSDASLLEIGVPALHIYFFGIFMMALQYTAQSTFVALGRSKNAVFFSIFRKIVIVVPLTLILPAIAGLGVTGVYLAEPVSNFVGGIASFTTMILVVWLKLESDPESIRPTIAH